MSSIPQEPVAPANVAVDSQAVERRIRMPALLYSPVGVIGAFICLFWIITSIFAPLIAPYSPTAQIAAFQPPGTTTANGMFFLLGTDHLGRDVLSRIIWGGRRVLFYATIATSSAYIVGISAGLVAGYFRGWVDDVLSSIANVILSFPILVLYVVIISTFGSSGINIVLAVTFASAPGIMRIVRAVVFDLRNREYVTSAQTRGGERDVHYVRGNPSQYQFTFSGRCVSEAGIYHNHNRSFGFSRTGPAATPTGLGRDD